MTYPGGEVRLRDLRHVGLKVQIFALTSAVSFLFAGVSLATLSGALGTELSTVGQVFGLALSLGAGLMYLYEVDRELREVSS